MAPRVPSQQEFLEYDGAHCFRLWAELPTNWYCPACLRTKFKIMRWTTRYFRRDVGKCSGYKGWMAGLHTHHDHSQDSMFGRSGRFSATIICDQCNSADGVAKKHLRLPDRFSFSPAEIAMFITSTPHARHKVDLEKAQQIYSCLGA